MPTFTDSVVFNNSANITPNPATGGLILATGTDTSTGAEFEFTADGKIKIDGIEFGGGSSEPTEPTTPAYPTPGAWTNAVFSSGWGQHPAATQPHETVSFRKVGHRVEIRGTAQIQVSSGTAATPGASNSIFRLPVGMRPAGQQIIPVAASGASGTAAAFIKIFDSGLVTYVAGPGGLNTWVGLSAISFPVDAA
jgi:hypothetical protein